MTKYQVSDNVVFKMPVSCDIVKGEILSHEEVPPFVQDYLGCHSVYRVLVQGQNFMLRVWETDIISEG